MHGRPTRGGANEAPAIACHHSSDPPLAVNVAVGQHHRPVVFIHQLLRDPTQQLAVHVLCIWQALRQPPECLHNVSGIDSLKIGSYYY